jgi:hypothetical protein
MSDKPDKPGDDWTGQPPAGKPQPYHAAFYVVPEAEPDDRVVVCAPAVLAMSAAIAVLKSAVREHVTGGVLSGPLDNLRACVDQIDQHDEGWPDDRDRLVAAVLQVASATGCSVQFIQNVEPNGTAQWLDRAAAVASPDGSRGPYSVRVDDDRLTVTSTVLWTGPVDLHRWPAPPAGLDVSYRVMGQRAEVSFRLPVEAAQDEQTSSIGWSRQIKDQFDHVAAVMDAAALRAPKYWFCLLVRDGTRSIVFFSTKRASNIRQAIRVYVAHRDGQELDETDLGVPFENPEAPEEPAEPAPAVGHCRFWRLHV